MSKWPRVSVKNLLKPVERRETVIPEQKYRLLGVRWYGQGLFIKEEKSGLDVRANYLYRVENGDFIYSRLFAWKGSFANATEAENGCYVSNEFPCFHAANNLNPSYLLWYFRREDTWNKALGLSSGATPTSRNRLNEANFLNMSIPLPSLDEQRAIVARLDAVAEKARQVEAKLDDIEADLDKLCQGLILSPMEGQARLIPMRELLTQRQPDILVNREQTYHFAGVYSFGRGVFKGVAKSGSDFAYERLSTIREGDFTYPKLMAWEGALGIVPPDCDGLVVSPEFPVFSVNQEVILPEVLDVYFKTPQIWSNLAEISTGTNQRRRRLQPSAFLNYQMPVPPMFKQKQLREMVKYRNEINKKHAETRRELKALLPSMLEDIFN
ncbi:restriction endonuclease subunit S [Methylomagnum sp.]